MFLNFNKKNIKTFFYIYAETYMYNIATQFAHLYFVNNAVYEHSKEIRGKSPTLSSYTNYFYKQNTKL